MPSEMAKGSITSVVRVPMKIMTKEEAKDFDKEWKEESKQEKHKE